ncbi:MAG: hypothetical protein ACRETC_10130 [Gammaproteobacteria bacterium]
MKWIYSIPLIAALALPAWAGSVNTSSVVTQSPTAQNRGAQTTYSNQTSSPPGVLRFGAHEVNRRMQGFIGKIAGLYAATLPSGVKGHLIVVIVPHDSYPIGVVQPDTGTFTLRKGERVIVMQSPTNAWMRVLPYSGPKPLPQHQ